MPRFKALFVGLQNSVNIWIDWKGQNNTLPRSKSQKCLTMAQKGMWHPAWALLEKKLRRRLQPESGKQTLHGFLRSSSWETTKFPLLQRFVFSSEANALVHRAALYLLIVSGGGNWFWFHILPLPYWHRKTHCRAGRRAFQLQALQWFPNQAPVLHTWLWKFQQWGIHLVAVTFLPNNKMSHAEVLAVNKERVPGRGQGQFFYSRNMVMQNLKNRK